MKRKIQQLNDDVELQVMQLEEVAEDARKNEQLKLGMELHDNMSARLAALVFFVDSQKTETKDETENKWLSQLKDYLDELYRDSRNRSHSWTAKGESEAVGSFSKTVKALLHKALPDGRYQKEIFIDDGALQNISISSRIELLYIIREATVNVLKHAGADKIDITIYEDKDILNIVIKDNGKGFDSDKILTSKKGIGVRNMLKRVKNLNGTINISSAGNGTEIIIEFPV